MKVQILSDLHLEHGGTLPGHHSEADVIVLAGDLAPYTEGLIELLAEYWSTALCIVYVLGNHEFYGADIDDTRAKLAKEYANAGIHLLDPGTIHIEGVRFIGATLWTDFELDGPSRTAASHIFASRGVSDFMGAIAREPTFAPCANAAGRDAKGPSLPQRRTPGRRRERASRASSSVLRIAAWRIWDKR